MRCEGQGGSYDALYELIHLEGGEQDSEGREVGAEARAVGGILLQHLAALP